jgi:hypothetical protein
VATHPSGVKRWLVSGAEGWKVGGHLLSVGCTVHGERQAGGGKSLIVEEVGLGVVLTRTHTLSRDGVGEEGAARVAAPAGGQWRRARRRRNWCHQRRTAGRWRRRRRSRHWRRTGHSHLKHYKNFVINCLATNFLYIIYINEMLSKNIFKS